MGFTDDPIMQANAFHSYFAKTNFGALFISLRGLTVIAVTRVFLPTLQRAGPGNGLAMAMVSTCVDTT
jgi:hypothetical protein